MRCVPVRHVRTCGYLQSLPCRKSICSNIDTDIDIGIDYDRGADIELEILRLTASTARRALL